MAESENVALVRAIIESFGAGDLEFPFAHYDPDIVWENFSPSPAGMDEVYEGHEGVRRFWAEWAEVISGVTLDVDECRTVRHNIVLVVARASGTGAGSGASVASRSFAQLAEFRDGQVVRVRLFGDVKRALAALD